ncbi:MAG: hypothetical protein G01um101429_915 [Parcubacteria group bacterium Gr01-1014_29]|nr:MAG: hypothetical protein G01um101429_915 [Parcubacteria group bacterium Gr01-1014_29]
MSDKIMFPVFEKFPEVRYGMSCCRDGTMNLGDPNGEEHRLNFLRDVAEIGCRSVFAPILEHGNSVACVTPDILRSKTTVADGAVTDIDYACLVVTGADCSALFAYDPKRRVYGLAHSGRKSTESNIASQFISAFRRYGSRPQDIRIAIGPGICGKCYSVGEEAAEPFRNDSLLKNYVLPSLVAGKTTHWFLDLPRMIRAQLEEIGVLREHIDISGQCTYEMSVLFSHRRDKVDPPKRMLAYIFLESPVK